MRPPTLPRPKGECYTARMARAQLILAHDLGTTGNKANLFDVDGTLLGSAFAGYATAYPQPNWAEQSPHDWWNAVCVTTRQLLAETGTDPHAIAAVVVQRANDGLRAHRRRRRPLALVHHLGRPARAGRGGRDGRACAAATRSTCAADTRPARPTPRPRSSGCAAISLTSYATGSLLPTTQRLRGLPADRRMRHRLLGRVRHACCLTWSHATGISPSWMRWICQQSDCLRCCRQPASPAR